MSTELEHYRPTADSWVDVLPQVGDLATKLANTDFVPDTMRGKPAAVAAAILTGRELGIGPMTALQHIHVVKGRPGMSAQLMRQLIFSAGHSIRYIETTNTRCVVEGRRRGEDEWERVTFTADQAKQAKINLGDYPEDKLVARATSRLARRKFADVLGGLPYLPEEAAEGRYDETAGVVQATPPAPPRKTLQRASAARAEAPTDVPPPPSPPPAVEQDEPGPDDGGEAASGPGTPPVAEVVEDVVDAELVEEEPPAPPAPKAHGGITPAQSRMLHASFNTCGVKTRDDRMRISSAIVGRHLESSSDLTKDEAGGLIDVLAQMAETDDPLIRLEALAGIAGGGLVTP